ncbi:hypothetical protein [Frigidibacter sp. MR17.24]|uniref:hypothetical protein n=1 Tax=Frigidibacter sp. MR17.24 TaxID=3127345 RepID=UPI003012BDBF
MQDNYGNAPRDPALDPRLQTTRSSGGNGIFFILGAIVVALGVIFFLVSGNEPSAPAPDTAIENNVTAPAADTAAPEASAPAATAPVEEPAAPAAPAPEAAPVDQGTETAPAPQN